MLLEQNSDIPFFGGEIRFQGIGVTWSLNGFYMVSLLWSNLLPLTIRMITL